MHAAQIVAEVVAAAVVAAAASAAILAATAGAPGTQAMEVGFFFRKHCKVFCWNMLKQSCSNDDGYINA